MKYLARIETLHGVREEEFDNLGEAVDDAVRTVWYETYQGDGSADAEVLYDGRVMFPSGVIEKAAAVMDKVLSEDSLKYKITQEERKLIHEAAEAILPPKVSTLPPRPPFSPADGYRVEMAGKLMGVTMSDRRGEVRVLVESVKDSFHSPTFTRKIKKAFSLLSEERKK